MDAAELLRTYYWPGNVRELANAIERAVVLAAGRRIGTGDLPSSLHGTPKPARGAPPIPGATLAEVERYLILQTLESTGGSTAQAADILGVSLRKIQYRIAEYRSSFNPGEPSNSKPDVDS